MSGNFQTLMPGQADGGRSGHYGLRGMRERSRILGAHLDVWTELDSGTEVELSIPASVAYGSSRLLARFSWLSWISWKRATHKEFLRNGK